MPKYDVISFLSDMGTVDESVGVCKAIIFQQAPHVNIFDITHDVPQFDVRAGALALTRAIQFLPNGIVIAAVDPGSPREQRYIAVEMAEGVLIGPDNGILAPAAQLIGEPKRVIHISNPEFKIEAPGNVFAARDILAPAAGVIAAGTDMGELGQAIPLDQLVPGMLQLSRHDEGGAFLGEVWSVDRFGNVQINITPEELELRSVKIGDTVTVRVGEKDFMAKFVERYADLAIAQVGILVDSTGMISIVKNLDYAARELDVREGKAVAILPQGSTITGRDITVDVFTPNEADADAGAAPVQAPSVQQPMNPSYDAGSISPSPSVPPFNPATQPEPNPQSQPGSFGSMPSAAPVPEHRFVEAEFKTDPSLPPDPFATPPVAPPQDTSQPQNSQTLGDYMGAPNVDSPATADYRPAPVSTPQPPQVNPGAFGTAPVQPPQTAQPVDPFASAPVAPPQAPPSQPPVVDSPASYFPPPVADNPPIATPEVSPAYGQPDQPRDGVTQPNPAGVPQNVFDLFKGNDEENVDGDTSADQNPQP